MCSEAQPVHCSQRFVKCKTLLTGPAMLAYEQGNSHLFLLGPSRLNYHEPLGMEDGSKCGSALMFPQRWLRKAKSTSQSELYKKQ